MFVARIEIELMYPYPNMGTHTISGESFDLMDGIFGMAVDKGQHDKRLLYFHSLASEHENSVPVSVLHNRTAWENDAGSAYTKKFQILGPRGSQSAASAIDANGNLFFGLNELNAIACWDTTRKPLTRAAVKTLVKDDDKLQFISGMKVIRNSDGEEELWLVTNRFQVSHFQIPTEPRHESYLVILFSLKNSFHSPKKVVSIEKIPIKLSCFRIPSGVSLENLSKNKSFSLNVSLAFAEDFHRHNEPQ